MSTGMSKEVYRDLKGHLDMADSLPDKMIELGLLERVGLRFALTERGQAYNTMVGADPVTIGLARGAGTC